MLSVPGIYENGKITLLEEIPNVQMARVIITVLEEWPATKPPANGKQPAGSWLGSLSHTVIGEIGDIVSPLEETWDDWGVLRA
jgi:hypothetical protein